MNSVKRLQSLKAIMQLAAQILREDGVEGESKEAHWGGSGRPASAAFFGPDHLASLAEAEYRQRRSRAEFLPEELFSEPAWDILLDLFIHECRGKMTPTTSACIASNVAPTTALRYLDILDNLGLIYRSRSDRDNRLRFVRLTNVGRLAMTEYFESQVDVNRLANAFALSRHEPRQDLIEP